MLNKGNKKSPIITLFFLGLMILVVQSGLCNSKYKEPGKKLNQGFYPYYVYFFSSDGDELIIGHEKEVFLYNEKTKEIKNILSGDEVRTLGVDRKGHDRCLVSIGTNRIFLIEKSLENNSVKKTQLSKPLQKHPSWIKGFLFYSEDPNVFLAYDSKDIYISRDKGMNWQLLAYPQYNAVSEAGQVIITVGEDPDDTNSFLFYHANGDRFRGHWKNGMIEYVEEKALPHGYIQKLKGVEFILIGKNARTFGFKNLGIQVLDYYSTGDQSQKTIYVAGLGQSSLKINKKKTHLDIMKMNVKDSLCVTVDGVGDSLVIGASNGVYISFDTGKSWEKILPDK